MAEHTYGFVQDGKVYRKAYSEHPALEIGEVKDTPEAAFAYYEQRFQQLQEKINQLEQDIYEKSNKGSYLMKLLHLKETLPQYEGLGDFPALHQRLEKLEEYLKEIIHQNRERNLQIKTALLQEAEQLGEVTNWKEGTEQAKDLKMRWLRTGSLDAEHQDEFEERFNALLQEFFDRRSAFYADRKLMMEERQKKYEMLIAEAQRAMQQPNTRQAYHDIKNIQERWREIGNIPAEHYKPLLQEIQRITRPVMPQNRPQRRPMGDAQGQRTGGSQRYGQQGHGRPQQRSYASAAPGQERLEERKALLDQLQAVDAHSRNALNEVEAIQNQYKELGFVRTPEVARLSDQLFDTANLIREKHFLNKLAHAKVPGIEQRDPQEQARQKMRLLRDLLSRDERELQNYQENMSMLSTGRNEVSKMMESKLRAQQRKVSVKKKLMEELKQQAES